MADEKSPLRIICSEMENSMIKDFLPISKEDMIKRGWEEVDFAFVIGDAYVDHPSFGHAIISRVLEANGYKVGIISQPDWRDKNSINASVARLFLDTE